MTSNATSTTSNSDASKNLVHHMFLSFIGALFVASTISSFTTLARATETLPIEETAVPAAIIDAGGRNGDLFTLKLVRCADSGGRCRFDAGGGVDLVVVDSIKGRVRQIEAGWSNSRATSTTLSAERYQAVCRAIVGALRPTLSRAQVAKLAAKITLLRKMADPEAYVDQRDPDVDFYGSRSVPDRPEFPTEAFVQCGATANSETP